MKQNTFGKTKVIDVESTNTKCKCGNNSVIRIDNNDDDVKHYCRICARNDWLEMREKYE